MFYKALFYSSALLVAATAWAFGGGGSNRTQQYYERGVDAIGIHRDINGEQGEIDFDDTCSAEEHKEYNAQGVCVCMDGYERDDKVCILACPEHATRNPETKECACDTGYENIDGLCLAFCGAHAARDTETKECVCDTGYEDVAGTCLEICPENTTRDTETKECVCAAGYYLNDMTCTPCAEGTYKATAGNDTACSGTCVAGQQVNETSTGCDNCAAGATDCGCEGGKSADGNGGCACPTGYEDQSSTCVLVSCPPLEQTTCDAMPHCHWSGSACLDPCTTGKFHSLSGTCTSCTTTTRTETTAKACAVCGDSRKVIVNGDTTYCATTDCGADKFQASTGMCYNCTVSTGYYVDSKEACETPCADRVAVKQGDGRWKCDKAEACSENEVRDPTTRECVCAEGYIDHEGICTMTCSDDTDCPESYDLCYEGYCSFWLGYRESGIGGIGVPIVCDSANHVALRQGSNTDVTCCLGPIDFMRVGGLEGTNSEWPVCIDGDYDCAGYSVCPYKTYGYDGSDMGVGCGAEWLSYGVGPACGLYGSELKTCYGGVWRDFGNGDPVCCPDTDTATECCQTYKEKTGAEIECS